MRRIQAEPERSHPPRGLRLVVGAFAIALPLLFAAPTWANNTVGDAISGDGTAVGGTNIAELKEQIKRDRLSCSGGEGGASALVAVGALGIVAARRRRRIL